MFSTTTGCDPVNTGIKLLSTTGLEVAIAGSVVTALLMLGLGLFLILFTRRRRPARVVLVVILLVSVGTFIGVVRAPSAQASASCSGEAHSLIIAQTSQIGGLAPGVGAQFITGTVTNTGRQSIYLGTVTVSISSVIKSPGAPTGSCSSNDYTLIQPSMPMNVTESAGATVPFHGATILFSDSQLQNQDACKGAILVLEYHLADR